MGASVRTPPADAPPQWYSSRCPCCEHKVVKLNGAWLRWKRESADLDQRTFAAKLGVSGPYLSDLERNRRDVPAYIEIAYRRLKVRRQK